MAGRRGMRETVLYYNPAPSGNVMKLKGILVRMGVRIKNVTLEQAGETIESLLGLTEGGSTAEMEAGAASIEDEVLVLHQFSSSRLDELLLNLRKAGVPRIALKAVVTESNIKWTFYQLYREIKDEHEKMQGNNQ